MNTNIVEIINDSAAQNIIEVSTSLESNNNVTIELSNSSNVNVDIINNTTTLISDLPQGYPLSWTVGDLSYSRVSGLDIVSGSGISITNNSGLFTIAVTGQFGLTGEQVDDRINNLLVAGDYTNLNYDDDNNILTISITGLQPSGNYSVVGHSHNSSDINDFNSSVDQRINLAHLQPSGNYSLVGHNHIISDISGLQLLLDSKQPSGNYSLVGHAHNISDINNLQLILDSKAPIFNPVFSGTVSGITKDMVGLGNIDNTSDINKPVSTAQAAADSSVQSYSIQRANHTGTQLSNTISDFNISVSGLVNGIYAPLNSPSLIGVPTAPTANSGSNNNQIANTAFVRSEISNLVGSAPSTLDTLNELASALGNDPNFATTVANSIGGKVSKSGDVMTGPLTAPSGNFTNKLTVNNIPVSLSGHIHAISDVTNLQTSLDIKAPILNPVFSGTVSGVTKSMVGLGNVDNTSDINKPISSATQNALNLKANLAHDHGNITSSGTIGSLSGQLVITTANGLLTTINSIPATIVSGLSVIATTGNASSLAYIPSGPNVLSTNVGDALTELDFLVENCITSTQYATQSSAGVIKIGSGIAIDNNGKVSADIQSVAGKIGIVTLTKSDVGLSNIDNTSDLNKPVSTAQAAANAIVQSYAIQRANHTGTQTSSTISDFNTSVSGLLPVKNVIGSGYINIISNTGLYTVSVSGLQPSGNYSLASHSHGNITSSGTIGNVSGVLLSTDAGGLISTINNSLTLGSTIISVGGVYSSLSGLTLDGGNI